MAVMGIPFSVGGLLLRTMLVVLLRTTTPRVAAFTAITTVGTTCRTVRQRRQILPRTSLRLRLHPPHRRCFSVGTYTQQLKLFGSNSKTDTDEVASSSETQSEMSDSSTNDRNTNTNTKKQNKQKQNKNKIGRKTERKDVQARMGDSQTGQLNWETFDFALDPKQDDRFGSGNINKIIEEEGLANVLDFDREVRADETYAQKLQVLNDAYTKLDSRLVAEATAIIEPYINKQRLERVTSVLQQRTKNVKFLFENPSNPSNVWACLRTIDSFGIQNVDVIINSKMYEGKQAITQKRGMRTAMGSAQWLTLTNHPTTYDAIETIRNLQGYKIYASDLNPNSQDIRNIQWNDTDNNNENSTNAKRINFGNSDRPICIVMGNEDRGISDEMRELADETFTLPMYGFAESFNLSVATSITLAHMSAKSSNHRNKNNNNNEHGIDIAEDDAYGPLRPGDLDEHEYNCLYLKGLLQSLPQKRMGTALLKQNGIILPAALNEL